MLPPDLDKRIHSAIILHFSSKTNLYVPYENYNDDGKLPFIIDGHGTKKLKDPDDHIEIFIDGPDITEQSTTEDVNVEVNVLINSLLNNKNNYNIHSNISKVRETLREDVSITGLGCLHRIDSVSLQHLGQVEKDTPLRQAILKTSYSLEINK